MKPFLPHLRTVATRLTLVVALCLGANLVAAADKKSDEKKIRKQAAADPKIGGDSKSVAKDAPAALSKTPPISIVFQKSTFATALEAGQDPFFPGSKRRLPKVPEPPKPKSAAPAPSTLSAPPATVPNVKSVVVVVSPDLISSANLTLLGLSGTKARRVAVVHTGARSYDFLKGDSTLIRLPNDKQLKVRCVDVRERSAVFEAEGQTKELFLREGVF